MARRHSLGFERNCRWYGYKSSAIARHWGCWLGISKLGTMQWLIRGVEIIIDGGRLMIWIKLTSKHKWRIL